MPALEGRMTRTEACFEAAATHPRRVAPCWRAKTGNSTWSGPSYPPARADGPYFQAGHDFHDRRDDEHAERNL